MEGQRKIKNLCVVVEVICIGGYHHTCIAILFDALKVYFYQPFYFTSYCYKLRCGLEFERPFLLQLINLLLEQVLCIFIELQVKPIL